MEVCRARAACCVAGEVLVLWAMGRAPIPDRNAAAGPNEVSGGGSGVSGCGLWGAVGRAEGWFLHHTGSHWWESWTMVRERSFQVEGPEREARL